MNANDILRYGHRTFIGALDGLPDKEWYTPNVCGWWAVKDIVAHLASYEKVLVDLLGELAGGEPTPLLKRFIHENAQFNEVEVSQRQDKTAADVLAEYETAHAAVMTLMADTPLEKCRQNGILAWYGATYDLEDFLVYTYYGHKREHAAQINHFRTQLKNAGKELF